MLLSFFKGCKSRKKSTIQGNVISLPLDDNILFSKDCIPKLNLTLENSLYFFVNDCTMWYTSSFG